MVTYENGKLRSFPVALQSPVPTDIEKVASASQQDFDDQELLTNVFDGQRFAQELETKLFDFGHTNPTTMSCGGCHSILTNRFDGAQYQFHMLGPAQVTMLTAHEVKHNASLLNKQLGLKEPTVPADLPEDRDSKFCLVTKTPFADVRSSQDPNFVRLNVMPKVRLFRATELDGDGRLGVGVEHFVHQKETSCAGLEPSLCTDGAFVTSRVDTLGVGSASGTALRVDPNDVSMIGIVTENTLLNVMSSTSDGWLKVRTLGTIEPAFCE